MEKEKWMEEYMKERGYVRAETYRDRHSVGYLTVFYTEDGAGEIYFHAGGEPEYFDSPEDEEYPSWLENEEWELVEVLTL